MALIYANKRDKNGNADHSFEIYLKEKGSSNLMRCKIIRRLWKTGEVSRFYKNHRARLESLDKMSSGTIIVLTDLNLKKGRTPNQHSSGRCIRSLVRFACKTFGW